MPSNRELLDMAETYGAHNYLPLPIVLEKGLGAKVWDVEGKEYLDFLSSYSATNFGHHHGDIVATLREQADRLSLCSRAFMSDELCYFVKDITQFCGYEMALPMNSGTEAVETALKLARKWGKEKKGIPEAKQKIICMENNFHGRTITVVSFSTEKLYRDGYGPFTPGFEVIPFGDIEALESAIDENTLGVLMEPIQAEAGILLPPDRYLSAVRELCTEKKVLLMLDEIQTGLGRTGRDFCYQHWGARPDVLILGKSLGGGVLPISAVLASRDVMEVIRPGEHGSTFGGNPLACAIARKSIQLLQQMDLSNRSALLGNRVLEQLQSQELPTVKEIRGKGLLIGLELHESAGGARKYCEKIAENGVLCKETHDHVVRIALPLTIEENQLFNGVDVIVEALK